MIVPLRNQLRGEVSIENFIFAKIINEKRVTEGVLFEAAGTVAQKLFSFVRPDELAR